MRRTHRNIKTRKNKILIIGPAPQNIGGISIHIRRLISMLKDECDFDIVDEGHKRWKDVFNLRSLNLITYIRKILASDIVHIHSGHFILRLFHVIVCRCLLRKYTVVTVHRDPAIEGKLAITRYFLSKCNRIITVNENGFNALVIAPKKERYLMIPAFLPPVIADEPELPNEIIAKIKQIRTDEKAVLMVSNAWKLVRHDNQDLYGLDMCVDAVVKLNRAGLRYYLIFVIADNTDAAPYVDRYRETIEDNNQQENIVIWEAPLSFVRLAQEADVVLRTTNTDGDAISIREALAMGKCVIASDVVKRPDGVCLFATRNIDSLVDEIKSATKCDNALNKLEQVDYHKIYLSIYKKAI